MNRCRYERTGNGTKALHAYRCSVCGHTRESNHPPERLHRQCGRSTIPGDKGHRRRWARIRSDPKDTIPPWDEEEAQWIIDNLCGPCLNRIGTRCKLRDGCKIKAKQLDRFIRKPGAACPILKW